MYVGNHGQRQILISSAGTARRHGSSSLTQPTSHSNRISGAVADKANSEAQDHCQSYLSITSGSIFKRGRTGKSIRSR